MSQATTKTVRLQFNQKGAWRNALDFDAGNDTTAAEIQHYAAMLAWASNARARIVTVDGLQTALAHWTQETGWVNSSTGASL